MENLANTWITERNTLFDTKVANIQVHRTLLYANLKSIEENHNFGNQLLP